jgi:excisionase family DNA binding protein
MTLAEVAAHLNLSRETVYRLVQRGEIPASKVGQQWRFRREKVDAWMESLEATQPKRNRPMSHSDAPKPRPSPAPGAPPGAEEAIREMVRRIVERFQPEKIIVFGSYARGTAGPDSDVDLLVVMPVVGSKREQAVQIHIALAGVGLSKDVVVVTPEEVERFRDVVGTIVHPAITEGRVLYERPV